jgi:hypothetical protein
MFTGRKGPIVPNAVSEQGSPYLRELQRALEWNNSHAELCIMKVYIWILEARKNVILYPLS